MQHDDVVWGIINKSHCSYKVLSKEQKFCRNEYNLTGFCSRASCPIANSQYATVREEGGIIYLYMKTADRIFFPNKSWEKIKLSRNFEKAIHQINENLLYWSGFIKAKCKQRFLKITQNLIRMRKLKLRREKLLVPLQSKIERREKRREEKALIAARIEKGVEKTLLDRLKKGMYSDLYNIPQSTLEEAQEEREVEESEIEEEEEDEKEMEIEREVEQFIAADSEEESDSDSGNKESVNLDSDFESSDEDIEDIVPKLTKAGKSPISNASGNNSKLNSKKRRPRVEIEYEREFEHNRKQVVKS